MPIRYLHLQGYRHLHTSQDNLILAIPTWKNGGAHYLRYALFNATKYVCHWDEEFGQYLSKKIGEGKHYNVAVSHAAKKLIRTISRMELTGEAYRK